MKQGFKKYSAIYWLLTNVVHFDSILGNLKYQNNDQSFYLALPEEENWYNSSMNLNFQSPESTSYVPYYHVKFNEELGKLEILSEENMGLYARTICQKKLKCFNTTRSINRSSLWLIRKIKTAFSDMFEQKVMEVKNLVWLQDYAIKDTFLFINFNNYKAY